MERIDGAGQSRTTESGAPIDPSGDLDGVKFVDAVGLGKAMRENPAVPSCIVNRMYSYATGRTPDRSEKVLLDHFEKQFASAKFRLPKLLHDIAASDALFAVTTPESKTAATNTEKDDKS